APASHAVKIPDALSAAQAAPLFCAGVTVYRALKHARISAGQRLAIFGIGGLGHVAVQVGRELGAEVIAVDVADEKLHLAETLGAATCLNAASTNVTKALRANGGGGASSVRGGGGVGTLLLTQISKTAARAGATASQAERVISGDVRLIVSFIFFVYR